MRIGLDIGSTTIKCVVVDANQKIIYKDYARHYSQITEKALEMLETVRRSVLQSGSAMLAISGSAGMGLSDECGIPFVQEVYATRVAAKSLIPDADVIIELGGEDAKILYLSGSMEVRMNGSCAGGTGAFIDQMATLLRVSADGLNELAASYEKIYTIASRCGVFAKSDIQPLLNQGARKSDIAASIFASVVNQTVAGLSQGREIKGKVLYLGGPLTFLPELRRSFDAILRIGGICPENSLYYVALGAALSSNEPMAAYEAISRIKAHRASMRYTSVAPLFEDEADYASFAERHAKDRVPRAEAVKTKQAYIGIDAGSTTVKAAVIDREGRLLYSKYQLSSGNPVPMVKAFLEEFYEQYPQTQILSSAVTGYGEEIIKNAFRVDYGIVETVAHFEAARRFMPTVDFIIDIGGQDIKCFKIRNGAIDNIFLNEACSSGCGSFLQTFANALGYSVEDFAKLGLFADHPVDLGSRCTVFMNSSVKQAQKDGASVANISAGLSVSVVKNALYKVIRAASAKQLGENIVVQGGTFLNDAVLRAFEQEMEVEVTRPDIAGLMGAYGAALYALSNGRDKSSILDRKQLEGFEHKVSVTACGLCSNNCRLTVNTFDGGRKFIGGNRCERPVTKKTSDDDLNIYRFKLGLLKEYRPVDGPRGEIGLPMGLNFYELLPFWHTLFTSLGFKVIVSPLSTRKLYLRGQSTIPSDTVCFPAKLMHGHVQWLIDEGVKTIFYPCLTYNMDEKKGDNHYNCPVVAYYPEVIAANMTDVGKIRFLYDYLNPHQRRRFPKRMLETLHSLFKDITLSEVKTAAKAAYGEYDRYLERVRVRGHEMMEVAAKRNQPVIVLAGRPYHADPEISHGIDQLLCSLGAAVVSEDVLSAEVRPFATAVLNQWTYHARLYAAAKYVSEHPNMNLVQLVSFGCGVDAITGDEVREILESNGKIYTQIKIDEITNLGAVKIRLRSLFAAAGEDKV